MAFMPRTEISGTDPVAGQAARRSFAVGACAAYSHVLGPAARFPYPSDRTCEPVEAPLEVYPGLGVLREQADFFAALPCPVVIDRMARLDILVTNPDRLSFKGSQIPGDTR